MGRRKQHWEQLHVGGLCEQAGVVVCDYRQGKGVECWGQAGNMWETRVWRGGAGVAGKNVCVAGGGNPGRHGVCTTKSR